jgi:hypothetical protein
MRKIYLFWFQKSCKLIAFLTAKGVPPIVVNFIGDLLGVQIVCRLAIRSVRDLQDLDE